MENPYKDELRINGKIYKRINDKWTIVEKSDVVNYNGKTYKKIYDELGTDPKVNCMKKCAFCEYDDEGEPCCGAPNNDFWGCHAGFHWKQI